MSDQPPGQDALRFIDWLARFCDQVEHDGIVPSREWFGETAIRLREAAAALAGASSGPAGSFGYCAVCYHPLDVCSHCGPVEP